ncbi:MAG: hypothetical protein Q9216_001764 [Gyalolechia sp. 2 TL-2023]
MSDLLQSVIGHQDGFRRARLPSLFSDFEAQRYTNPDGYFANISIWKDILCNAAYAGLIQENDSSTQRFSLEIGPQLLQKLESKEWGRPLALNSVIVIKFASPEEVLSPISKEDRAIASLKSLMDDINGQIRLLEKRIEALREKANSAVEMKNRFSALAALRSKRSAQSALSRRVDTLSQLEEVYGRIEQASEHVTMLQVVKASTAVLHSLNARTGNIQDVEDVLDGLKQEMGKVEEIGSLINDAEQERNTANEDEIDEELEALMGQSQSAEEEKAVEETKRKLAEVHFAGVSNPNSTDHLTPSIDQTSANPTAASHSSIFEA